ncbi:acyl carrier protein [Neolewinella aurantiaca]|uniref:Acyl carrier protein n=1 Tax=Neolewinella aurantiaca TaxID=2602767 RepID=A0A5C7F490_9BACT|nr:acyl carrier protein [Neolewinella aurantiaca]TXF85442.1 acyl carrier protein [Neolewinella aurantiaca]
MTNIKEDVKAYIIEEFAYEADVGPLTDSTPLLSSGIIDSISALQLVEFLENKYSFSFQAHEVDQDNLDNLALIEAFVMSKVSAK